MKAEGATVEYLGAAEDERASLEAARPILTVADLAVHFPAGGKRIDVVSALNYQVDRNATLALVGESGSGKSISCRAVLGLLPKGAVVSGSACFDGTELLELPESLMRRVRGRSISMVFQDAARALNPTMQVGHQIGEALRAHEAIGRQATRRRVLELLQLLRLPAPPRMFHSYPHELSGGMRQRVMIGVAIASNPRVLIADEPTSSLDVPTGIEIMELLRDLQRQLDMSIILVSHDMRLVMNFADSIVVMRGGRPVESGPASRVLASPENEYTQALLDAVPVLGTRPSTPGRTARRKTSRSISHVQEHGGRVAAVAEGESPVLSVRNVVQELPGRRRRVRPGVAPAMSDVTFDLFPGEILGIVGETGAGKSTLMRTLLQMPPPTSGSVVFRDVDLCGLRGRRLRDQRRGMQMVFQDPFASLDPNWKVADIVEEPLISEGYGGRGDRRRMVEYVLDLVGLPFQTFGKRRPGELSGGECQRVAIARALVIEPRVLICDEALSSLDVISQKEIVELIQRLRSALNLAVLYISHDLPRLSELSDRILVMHLGRLCEIGPTRTVCLEPLHPYMAALIDSVRGIPVPPSQRLCADRPSLWDPVSGCRFHTRCARAEQRCVSEEPRLRAVGEKHLVACHFAGS